MEGLAYADSPTNLMWRLQNPPPKYRTHQPRRGELPVLAAEVPALPEFGDLLLEHQALKHKAPVRTWGRLHRGCSPIGYLSCLAPCNWLSN